MADISNGEFQPIVLVSFFHRPTGVSWPNILIRPSNRLLSGQSPKGVTVFE